MPMLQLIAAASAAATAPPSEASASTETSPPVRCTLVPGSVEVSGQRTRRTFIVRCPGAPASRLSLAYGTAEAGAAGVE